MAGRTDPEERSVLRKLDRWFISIILSVYTLAVVASGFARLSWADLTNGWLGAEPMLQQSRANLRLGEFERARSLAKKVVQREPMRAVALAHFGSAALANSETEAADNAYRAASKLSWRNGNTQLYFYALAVRNNDWQHAAMRISALLKTQPQWPTMNTALSMLEANPEGQVALASQLSQKPNWLRRYLTDVGDLNRMQLAARVEVVLRIEPNVECPDVAALGRKLQEAANSAAEQSLTKRFCTEPA